MPYLSSYLVCLIFPLSALDYRLSTSIPQFMKRSYVFAVPQKIPKTASRLGFLLAASGNVKSSRHLKKPGPRLCLAKSVHSLTPNHICLLGTIQIVPTSPTHSKAIDKEPKSTILSGPTMPLGCTSWMMRQRRPKILHPVLWFTMMKRKRLLKRLIYWSFLMLSKKISYILAFLWLETQ